MYLFSRVRMINIERSDEAMALAVELAKYASKATKLEVTPWAAMYGAPLGAISASARVESQAAMGAAQQKLAGDANYQKMLADARPSLFTGPVQDNIGQFIQMAELGDSQYASVVTAQCAPGKIGAAMAWSVDITTHVGKVTGLKLSLVRGMYGPFASMSFISLAKTLAEVDTANDALAGDAGYVVSLDAGGSLFQPGSVNQVLLRRLG